MYKPSILIVDDEESIRVSLENILIEENYFVKTANNGLMALEMLQNDHYDVILTDIVMDDMTGVELLKKIKDGFPEILVLLMTGYSSIDTAVEAVRLGASDYLIKPFTYKVMLSSITHCLENHTTVRKNKSLTKLNILPGKKPFTKRELEVCNLLTSGMSDKYMAEELFVSVPTIKFHLQNIYKKSGINGRKGIWKYFFSNDPTSDK
jgi:DNA-binding NarL/FixJ family response regulator